MEGSGAAVTWPVEVGLSLGSNIGDKAGHIRRAVAALADDGLLADMTLSRLYRTAPWGHVVDQDWFVNACAFGFTTRKPADLLAYYAGSSVLGAATGIAFSRGGWPWLVTVVGGYIVTGIALGLCVHPRSAVAASAAP